MSLAIRVRNILQFASDSSGVVHRFVDKQFDMVKIDELPKEIKLTVIDRKVFDKENINVLGNLLDCDKKEVYLEIVGKNQEKTKEFFRVSCNKKEE